MKKLLLLLLFALVFSLSGYAQLDSLNIDATQAERIIDKYTGKVTEGFNTVLEKATPVAEEGFESCIYDGTLYLVAPEWFAIKDIIGLFNGS